MSFRSHIQTWCNKGQWDCIIMIIMITKVPACFIFMMQRISDYWLTDYDYQRQFPDPRQTHASGFKLNIMCLL